ncbi:cytochrome c-type biogenesis protein [Falsirhodobacter xinxiangensis]|uniref:cytochrome c-type biogenesis protein n=1 Tax=Falsirhodobacter xinxiangensis TaxID=2530049 RepID=UPI0010AA7B97|nr:cytochrome c-type biogenesis protein [Rhodobacter xinxiangensis]
MIRVLVLSLLLAGPAFAVQPGEMLSDPELEARAREISKGLRCPVCRNENIDDSNATIASDLRLLVRERLVAGDDDQQVVDFVVDRYGEYVLLNPVARGAGMLLWIAGPLMLLGGGAVALTYLRRRRPVQDTPLSEEERARLDALLKD